MEVEYTLEAQADIAYWKRHANAVIMKKITELIAAISQDPCTGSGKPEALKYEF
jgi:toxin YoeB